MQLIGRSRKYIQEEIEKNNEDRAAFIPFVTVENIITDFCVKQGLKVDTSMVRNLIAFSMTGEKVDYHLLVNKFKDLSLEISEFPKKNVFWSQLLIILSISSEILMVNTWILGIIDI